MKAVKIVNKVLLVIVILTAAVFMLGVSYSFFTSGITGSETEKTVTIEAGNITVVYNGGPDIESSNVEPSTTPFATKTFTITCNNTFANKDVWYELTLVVDENTFSTDAITYTLQGTNNAGNGKMIADVTTRTGINTSNIKLGRGKFSGILENAVHTYELKIYFYETNIDQSIDLGKTFRAHITMEKYTPVPLNNYIIGLAGTDQGTGKVINENGYRYEGLNPNNYVFFNNELWRIIGVFDSNTHNKTGQNLVKIIRSASIGNINWYTGYSTANWETASLKIYLNGTYYNGLSTASKNMIENVTWKLGGRSDVLASASAFYSTERGTVVSSGNAVSIVANIGLMYPSDWGYAVLGTSCPRSTRLCDYNSSGCYNQNWLYINYQEWTITHRNADGNQIVHVYQNRISSANGTSTHVVRPVVYLKSNTLMMGGTGTSADPYIIE